MAKAAIDRVIGNTKKVCERERLGSNSLKYEVIYTTIFPQVGTIPSIYDKLGVTIYCLN